MLKAQDTELAEAMSQLQNLLDRERVLNTRAVNTAAPPSAAAAVSGKAVN